MILFDPSKLPKYAWYGINSENRTHEVGRKKPNSFNLYDMIGNVREWVKDCSQKYITRSVATEYY